MSHSIRQKKDVRQHFANALDHPVHHHFNDHLVQRGRSSEPSFFKKDEFANTEKNLRFGNLKEKN